MLIDTFSYVALISYGLHPDISSGARWYSHPPQLYRRRQLGTKRAISGQILEGVPLFPVGKNLIVPLLAAL